MSVANAHPFLGCESGPYAVVLNGIIENFASLRDELVAEGHAFESTTDAEVVAHLLERHQGLRLPDAMAAVVPYLNGHFGIVALDSREPDVIVGTRHQVPLVVGIGDDEHFICSSVDTLLEHTDTFLLLEDHDIVTLKGGQHDVRSLSGTAVRRDTSVISRAAASPDKGDYGSYMAKEMAEQPRAIADTLFNRIHEANVRLCDLTPDMSTGDLDLMVHDLVDINHIVIVGCGTALHAGKVAIPMFQGWSRIRTEAAIASEWRHSLPLVDSRTLVIAVSQSGETADTLEAVRLARNLGAVTFGVTNMPDSQLTREVDRSLLTYAGLEMSVAATKTFTAQVVMLALLAFEIASTRSVLSEEDAERALIELELIPEKMTHLLSQMGSMKAIAEHIADEPFVIFLGRRSGVPVALEGALKLRESAYMPAEVHPAGELKHGSIALIEQGTPVVAVVTDDTEPERTSSNLHEVKARGAYVIAIATEGNTSIKSIADEVIYIPATDGLFEPLMSVIPLQQLAHDVAIARGLNVDQPRNLAKTVTVE